MNIVRKIKRAVRGEVAAKATALEALRRSSAAIAGRRERNHLQERQQEAARFRPPFDSISTSQLLDHFRSRQTPVCLPGFSEAQTVSASLQRTLFPEETAKLLANAELIVSSHRWPLLGLDEQDFGEQIDWHRDPLSGAIWPRDYHADINLSRGDGSDVRLLWELNRFPQAITLARAFAVTNDERFSAEFFSQVESWRAQNPYGYGVNWSCAMEVGLRAMNLLVAFEVFRHSSLLDEQKLGELLALFNQHGTFIKDNLEFSYIATSNHYLSDVVGLVWLGLMLPELEAGTTWRDFGLREMLREMDKQVLADGADFEASTGYHRFVLELFLYTFILCRANEVEIEDRYWTMLHDMLRYLRAYVRPDGRAPLVGDTDSGQALSICTRAGDDHAYLLAIGAALFNDPSLITKSLVMPEEVLWILGEDGVNAYRQLEAGQSSFASQGFPDAGTYVMRDDDLYLLFNTSGAGINGRGSHGHNDSLSIEVSACGRPFIVDPGSYVYTADLQERHLFRSTAYHSTVEIDGREQNTTEVEAPFVIGNEAQGHVLLWETGAERDRVSAEHKGYKSLTQPVTHRRTITFNKADRWWLVDDEFLGVGQHNFFVRFHFDTGIDVSVDQHNYVRGWDKMSGTRLLIYPLDLKQEAIFESQFCSRDYGEKQPSISAGWSVSRSAPCRFRWALVPVCVNDDERERLSVVPGLAETTARQRP
jgi:heparinase II/III-like protein